MPKVLALYYSRTGNTEKMANAVAEGARSVGNTEVEMEYHVDADDLNRFDAIVVGVSTYHHDMPIDVKRLFEEAAEKGISLKGKTAAAFGVLRLERRSIEAGSGNHEEQVRDESD